LLVAERADYFTQVVAVQVVFVTNLVEHLPLVIKP
jgi:hypothetical protein